MNLHKLMKNNIQKSFIRPISECVCVMRYFKNIQCYMAGPTVLASAANMRDNTLLNI